MTDTKKQASQNSITKKNTRTWQNSSVWTLKKFETQPGQLNASIQDLKKYWLPYIKAQIKTGDVISYKMFVVHSHRENEPDFMLMIEYKNWAAFDRDPEYFENLLTNIFGTFDNAVSAKLDRQSLRVCRGQISLQEILFLD